MLTLAVALSANGRICGNAARKSLGPRPRVRGAAGVEFSLHVLHSRPSPGPVPGEFMTAIFEKRGILLKRVSVTRRMQNVKCKMQNGRCKLRKGLPPFCIFHLTFCILHSVAHKARFLVRIPLGGLLLLPVSGRIAVQRLGQQASGDSSMRQLAFDAEQLSGLDPADPQYAVRSSIASCRRRKRPGPAISTCSRRPKGWS